MDTGYLRGTVRRNMDRDWPHDSRGNLLIFPGDAVVGQPELSLLLKINGCRDHRRDGDDDQQRVDQLLS